MIRLVSTLLLAALAQGAPPEPGKPTDGPVKVETFLSVDRVRPGDSFRVAVVFTIRDTYHIYAPDEKDANFIKTNVALPNMKGFSWEAPRYPASIEKKLGSDTLRLYEKTAVVVFGARADEGLPEGKQSVTLAVDYQSCTDEFCESPQMGVPIPLEIPIAAKGADAKPTHSDLFAGVGEPNDSDSFGRRLEKSLFGALALLLLGGVATAFTPCVLPMIPFTVAFFTNQVDRSKGKTLVMALTYTAGIVTTFSLLGWLFGRAGSSAGTILGSPWVIGAFIVVFVGLALSCYGLFELTIPAPVLAVLGGGGSREGRLGAYVMGLLLGVVAAPCVGPVLAGLLLWIAKGGSGLAGLLFMAVFGLGLGLPFIALAFASGSIPRAGSWMVWVKEIFGALMVATAIYYLSTLVSSKTLIVMLVGIGFVALAIRYGLPALRRTESEHKSLPLGIVAAALSVYFIAGGLAGPRLKTSVGIPPPEVVLFHESWLPWRTDHDAALADAKRDGKPVFVDFTATWCYSCHEMESMMEEAEVWAVLQRFVLIKVDCTAPDDEGTRLRQQRYHDLGGVPSQAFYDSKGNLVEAHFGELHRESFLEKLHQTLGDSIGK